MTSDELLDFIPLLLASGKPSVIANHNLHSIYLYHSNKVFRDLYSAAAVVLVDGFPILLAAKFGSRTMRMRRALTKNHRVGSLDWILRVGDVEQIKKIALVGAVPAVNRDAVDIFSKLYPHIDVQGWSGDSWTADRAQMVVNDLCRFNPDMTLIGLGMPLQEVFLAKFLPSLPSGVFATVGGALDQITGHQKAAPRWLGGVGLEWMWRLVSQPRRLAYRYLIEPWKLVALLIRNRVR